MYLECTLSMSKFYEYLISDQVTQYLRDNNPFSLNQNSFRVPHSTELVALNIVDRLTYLMNQGKIPLNIYIDLSKAFDTLNFEARQISALWDLGQSKFSYP